MTRSPAEARPRPVLTPLAGQVTRALAGGAEYLVALQGADGSWTDVWLEVGASTGWVTGFVGTALGEVSRDAAVGGDLRVRATDALARACAWLEQAIGRRGGWSYNEHSPPDADSTAWAVTCLALAGRRVPVEALSLLSRSRVAGSGTRTYRRAGSGWDRPLPDVAAAALRAAYEAGALDRDAVAAGWLSDVAPSAAEDGTWPAFWWSSSVYPTALALDVWSLAGRPAPRRPPVGSPFDSGGASDGAELSAFERAWLLTGRVALSGRPPSWASDLQGLLRLQEPDGGWPFGRFLIVPPSSARNGDARRLLTTASAVMALMRARRCLPRTAPPVPERRSTRRRVGGRSGTGRRATELVRRAAVAVGFAEACALDAARVFDDLTIETFAEPSPWPSAQLSSLGAGIPLEFSVTAGPHVSRGLRYSVEVGDPLLPAAARARSAVEAIHRAARTLGYDAAWDRVAAAVDLATDPALPVTDGCRFWVWSGLDQSVDPAGRAQPPGLKIYLSLLQAEVGGARERMSAILAAAGIPDRAEVRDVLDELDAVGFAHEAGFGLGPGGRIAVKVYYELSGWRAALVARLLSRAGLAGTAEEASAMLVALRPAIPDVLGETLAMKSRAGIAMRLDPETGAIREMTTAVAFPPPLPGNAEISRRVLRWIERSGWQSEYVALARLLLPAGEVAAAAARRGDSPLHSLMTRTAGRGPAWTTIYLRPALDDTAYTCAPSK